MEVHTLTARGGKPTSGRFVYKSDNQWTWQCDLCYAYEVSYSKWVDALSTALDHAYLCPHVNKYNRSYVSDPVA